MSYCKNCGAELAQGAHFCSICGTDQRDVTTNSYQTPVKDYEPRQMAPNNHLVKTIVGMFLCLPFALVGLLNAIKVDNLWAQGNKRGAMECAKKANTWGNVALIAGGVYFVFLIIMGILSAVL